jgi:DNA-damage-inducible protein D
MTTVQQATASPFDVVKQFDGDGEYWSARDLMPLLGYDRWERFEDAIERAQVAISNTGMNSVDHIRGAAKLVQNGLSGVDRKATDYRLNRFGAYMVAMNSDPRKQPVAKAQTYFAVKTREAETAAINPAEITRADMARMILAAEEELAIANKIINTLEPLATSWTKLAEATGDYSVREAAQILSRDGQISIGQRRLFDVLKTAKWISDASHCYQRHVDLGRVRLKTDTYYDPYTGEPHLRQQVRITSKGLGDLHQLLGAGPTAMALPGVTA